MAPTAWRTSAGEPTVPGHVGREQAAPRVEAWSGAAVGAQRRV